MRNKKWLRILGLVILGILLLAGGFVLYSWYTLHHRYFPETNRFTQAANYIDPEKAIDLGEFTVCDEDQIYDYYNSDGADYQAGKNGLRTQILSQYQAAHFKDSGYLNIRFVVNCQGEPGRYVMETYDLDLNASPMDEELKAHLFNLTRDLKDWNPIQINDTAQDAYVYISYRLENGKIVAILP